MPLYCITDDNENFFVVSNSMAEAIRDFRETMAVCEDCDAVEIPEPDTVQFVCEHEQLIINRRFLE